MGNDRVRGQTVVVGNLPDSASLMRLTFCSGQSIDLPPLNTEGPRFVAAKMDTDRYGYPPYSPSIAASNRCRTSVGRPRARVEARVGRNATWRSLGTTAS